jgi:hypothetical protein
MEEFATFRTQQEKFVRELGDLRRPFAPQLADFTLEVMDLKRGIADLRVADSVHPEEMAAYKITQDGLRRQFLDEAGSLNNFGSPRIGGPATMNTCVAPTV